MWNPVLHLAQSHIPKIEKAQQLGFSMRMALEKNMALASNGVDYKARGLHISLQTNDFILLIFALFSTKKPIYFLGIAI